MPSTFVNAVPTIITTSTNTGSTLATCNYASSHLPQVPPPIKSWQAGTLNQQTNDIKEWFKKKGQGALLNKTRTRPRVHPLPMEDPLFKRLRALIEPDYEEMDEPEAKRAKKAHDAKAMVLATNWQLYKEESDEILKREDRHFKSLRAAKDFDKEHALNVGELLGFIDEH
ncbi:hypothetical protein BC830DRAFT_127892 [Chytriomyces sp. MP71]|nr:hypothetical protein BC830DRAFT_127892 [Chytriomyces sp. MP71]